MGDHGVRVYLDHASTTPVRPEAAEAMWPFLAGTFGNPSGSHAESRAARRAVEDARDQIGRRPGGVPRRGGLHLRGDRGRQPGRLRRLGGGHGHPPGADRRWSARPWSTTPCS